MRSHHRNGPDNSLMNNSLQNDYLENDYPGSNHYPDSNDYPDSNPDSETRVGGRGRRWGGRREEFRRRREFAVAGFGPGPRFGPRFQGPQFDPEDDEENAGFGPRGPRGRGPFGPGRFGPGGFGPGGFGGGFGPGGFGPGGPGPGGFGPGGPGGRGRGGRGHGPGRGRRPRGNVRAAVLALLAEEPRHGYAIMTELAERSGGLWRPSPGSVYPVLQQLQDEGLVTAEESEGRKVFAITEAGRKLIEDNPSEFAEPWSMAGPGPRQRVQALFEGMTALGSATQQVARLGTAEQSERARAVLDEARRALYRILAEEGSATTRAASDDDGDGAGAEASSES
jgi:DNA-binding PadR family transcriptional regulator